MIQIKRIFSCLLLAMVMHTAFPQGVIEFISEKDEELVIYRPIDGSHNSSYPTDTIQLLKNVQQAYHVNVENWSIVRCKLPNRLPLDIFIEKNDTARVINKNQEIVFKDDVIYESDILFEGANAAANDYSYLYIFAKKQKVRTIIDSIFQSKDTKLIDEVVATPRLLVRSLGVVEKINSMYANKQISPDCYNYLHRNLDYTLRFRILRKLDEYNYHGYINDSIYDHYKNRILDDVIIDSSDIRSMSGRLFVSTYYRRLYELLDDDIKRCMISKYGKETFGSSGISRLLAPERVRLNLLFDEFLIDYQYKGNTFNRFKLFEYLRNKYPESESVQILKKFVEEEAKDTIPIQAIFLDSIPIRSFSDIQQLVPFKGKYLFVDIWASWCYPCRAEFSYQKQLSALLKQYPNVGQLYISVDDKEDDWKKAIETMRISGHHVRASDELSKFLIEEVYQSGRITVPRYILIDHTGKILSRNLPRPSSIKELKSELDKFLRN